MEAWSCCSRSSSSHSAARSVWCRSGSLRVPMSPLAPFESTDLVLMMYSEYVAKELYHLSAEKSSWKTALKRQTPLTSRRLPIWREPHEKRLKYRWVIVWEYRQASWEEQVELRHSGWANLGCWFWASSKRVFWAPRALLWHFPLDFVLVVQLPIS